ncbi:MAG: RidA family protein [bacterium]|nr:RidA family protein [bacterium]
MREVIRTAEAPAAVGPYSQGVVAAGLVWVSGQIPFDPATGRMVEGGIEAQTERVMLNVGAVLEAGGSGFDKLIRATIYLTDLGDFEAVNAVYARFFSGEPPARACVEVSRLPKGVAVEIDAVGLR